MSDADTHRLLMNLSASWVGFPEVLFVAADTSPIHIAVDVPESLCWFKGHFPEIAVLPGIVQLHWAVQICRTLYGFDGARLEIKRLKFKKVVLPPRELQLVVSRHGENQAQFAYSSVGEENSEGRLIFTHEE
jgi:3-hydroxymyristoyl/3-hydroxydecanoyl-(acyl carrier protein) dehydratase